MMTVTLAEIQAARERVGSHLVETPVIHDEALSRQHEAEVWFKWENHQTTGAFKLRGALNKILPLTPEDAPTGVVTASAGNHGLGVAYAARLRGLSATVYVPDTAPQKKLRGLAQLGARVIAVPGGYGDAEDAALAAAQDSGAIWVSAYNDLEVIAGQGTLALEWLAQVPSLDLLLVPVGGGGLISGLGVAAKAIRPEVRVVGVQAAASAALHAAFYGQDMNAVTHTPTLADGLAGRIDPASVTIHLLKQVADDVLLVGEAEIERAMAYAYRAHGEVIEGAAAVGLAALLASKITCVGCVVGVLVTGGNVDPDRHAVILEREV